jgi:hypothetical protein
MFIYSTMYRDYSKNFIYIQWAFVIIPLTFMFLKGLFKIKCRPFKCKFHFYFAMPILHMLNLAHVDKNEFESFTQNETENKMTIVLLEDLPQLSIKSINTITLGHNMTWWEVISIMLNLASAMYGLTAYTFLILKGKWKWGPGLQWALGTLILIVITFIFAEITNWNYWNVDYAIPDWAAEHFSQIRYWKAGLV